MSEDKKARQDGNTVEEDSDPGHGADLRFSHLGEEGNLRMVDVSGKPVTRREARARAVVRMGEATVKAVTGNRIAKGNVLSAAEVAGILAAKKVGELVPLCHALSPDHIEIVFRAEPKAGVLEIVSSVSVTARTGAEIEALQAAAQAAITVYDMCKSADRGMTITDLQLIEKKGGRSGSWSR
jgi:cyclic pyranopterin phosphate synthase